MEPNPVANALPAMVDKSNSLVIQLVFVVAFEHFVFGLKLLAQYVVPDVPEEVKVAIDREQYIANITINGQAPAEDDEEAKELLGAR
jgi:hypothetical protein